MKKLLGTLLLIGIGVCGLQAQTKLFVRGGLQASIARLDSLNGVLQRFNDRSNPTEDFKPITLPLGPSFGLGILGEKYFIDASLSFQWQRRRAENTFGQSTEAIDVRLNLTTFNLGIAYRLGQNLAAGISLDIGGISTSFRRGTIPGVNTARMFKVSNDVTLGNSLFLQIDVPIADRFAVGVRPFYHFNYILADFGRLNQSLNPTTYLQDNQFILGRTGQAGVRASLTCVL